MKLINNTRSLILFISISTLVSCTKELEIPIPAVETRYVIRSEFTHYSEEVVFGPGVITPFTFPGKLTISKSAHVFDSPIDSINFVNVLLFKNGTFIDTISYNNTKGYFDLFETKADYPTFNDKLTVQIITPNQTNITASTYIPSEVKLDSLKNSIYSYYSKTEGLKSEAVFYFKDDPSTNNYYEITISGNQLTNGEPSYNTIETDESFITSEAHYPGILSHLNNSVQIKSSLLFTDKTFNGQNKAVRVYYMPGYVLSDSIEYLSQTLVFQLRNVSKEYYDFITTKRIQLISSQEDILYGASEPSPVKSNVTNGLGLFGGFSYAQKVYFFPQQTFSFQ